MLQHFVEDLPDHFMRRCVASLHVFGQDSVVVTCFNLLEAINGSLHFNLCELWYFIFHVFAAARLPFVRLCFPSFEILVLRLQAEFRHIVCCGIHRRHWQFLSLMWLSRLCHFSHSGWELFPSRFYA